MVTVPDSPEARITRPRASRYSGLALGTGRIPSTVLEEAVLVHRPVAVALRDGEKFIDVVTDVVTENHEDYAVFRTHERVAVTAIAAATRCEPHKR